MITATPRPRHGDIRLIDTATGDSFDVALADAPDLVDALCDAIALPRRVRDMAEPAIFVVPVEDYRSAR